MSELHGTWYDGRSSRGQPARLASPSPGKLRIVAGDMVREFDAGEARLSPRLGRLARQLRFADGAHLEIEDAELLDQWLPPRGRIEAGVDWLERRRAAVLSATVGLVVGVWAFFQLGLPWMAREVAPLVPPAIEHAISKQGLALLEGRLLEPTRLPATRRESLQVQFHEMTRHLPRGDGLRLDFRHAPGLGPNAFVLPNGLVVMTDQLVTLAGDDEELLAVLAHEAGHHEQCVGVIRQCQAAVDGDDLSGRLAESISHEKEVGFSLVGGGDGVLRQGAIGVEARKLRRQRIGRLIIRVGNVVLRKRRDHSVAREHRRTLDDGGRGHAVDADKGRKLHGHLADEVVGSGL